MGITGLLPYLAPATKPCHISEFRGGTVAVDSYCLLHKGANSCAEQLARGEDCQMYVTYCIKYVKMLLSYDIHPIMVFDGRNLPAKAETETRRREARKKAKQKAAELLKLGKADEARTYLKQCIDITPKMAHNLIKACRQLKVDCMVAPYESDAQLAFFNIKGIADCVITEDSDLVLFGCKKVLYKLDLQGAGRLVEADKISTAMKMRSDQFSFNKFRYMCILSGCDYVDSLNGIGLKKAEKFFKLTAETNPEIFLDRIPRYLNMKHLEVTAEYKKNVLIANATFLHQVVFDPYKKKLVHLTDPELCGTDPDHLVNAGEKFDNEKAYQVALGNLNPYTFEKYDDWTPSDLPPHSIWSGVYKKRISKKQEKEMQKAMLQEYCKNENVTNHSSAIEEELYKVQLYEEDCQIDKELSVYTKKLQVKENLKESDLEIEKSEETNQSRISPVLSKNPFLKRKRISKFPKTFTYGTTVVKSRFFSLEPVEDIASKDESATSREDSNDRKGTHSVEQTADTLLDRENTLFGPDHTDLDPDDTDVDPDDTDIDPDDISQLCEVTMKVVSKGKLFEETDLEVSQNEEDVKVTDLVESADVEYIKTEILNGEQHNAKRRKLGPCRTIGLKKKSSAQPTLHHFFSKLKPE